jgi:DNA-binding transcriptional regulator YhcF (GntR family)
VTAFAVGGLAASVLAAAASGGRRKTRSGAPHRTGAPVRADSLEAGTFEATFFVMPAKGETDRMLRAAREALDVGRKLKRDARANGTELSASERVIAALTAGAVRVFEEICTIARLCAGQVFPSYDHLADATGLGRGTVARVLPILDRAGFLVRQRRFARVEVEGDDEVAFGKPRYRQTSNVYRPMLPKAVIKYLPRWMRPAPPPVDAVALEAERQAEHRRMLAGLSCRDFARAHVGGALGEVLAKLGAGIDARSEALREAEVASTITVLNR